MRIWSLLFAILTFHLISYSPTSAQKPEVSSSSDIHHAIKGLDDVGSVLYLAAHPDDENTQMISYFSNAEHLRTAYLSLTRGDGGQNLLGPEMRAMLGVLRTQELLQARSIDGGIQYFTRANDFGYSKSSGETLEIWNEEEVLADVVWTIRRFKPDIIINRFNHEETRRTHGHHSASAQLSKKAFELAGDPTAYPEQLKFVEAWQPKRLFFNTSWWFYGSREAFEEADKSKMIPVNVGVYYSLLGQSNTEIAAASRSMHKCQGFGVLSERGKEMEFLELVDENRSYGMDDPMEGINTNWSRVKGSSGIEKIFREIDDEYNDEHPAASIPKLLEAYNMVQEQENEHWKAIKSKEIKEIIYDCAGFYFEAVAENHYAVPGESLPVEIEAINRSNATVQLDSIQILPTGKDTTLDLPLRYNVDHKFSTDVTIPETASYTTPYWLNKPGSKGMYTVEDQTLRGMPETPNPHKVRFHVYIDGETLTFDRPIVFKERDPVQGEAYRPFEVIPNYSVSTSSDVLIFPDNETREVQVTVTSHMREAQDATLTLETPDNWQIAPETISIDTEGKGDQQVATFSIRPPEGAGTAKLNARIHWEGQVFDRELKKIAYDHIPTQTVLRPAEVKVAKLDLQKAGELIGYIPGAGDDIPTSLRQIGYDVQFLDPVDIKTAEHLKAYDAIVIGIRAYNTVPEMKNIHTALMNYVEDGGTVVAQYSKSYGLLTDKIGPYPMEISRDRVTVEEAPVKMIAPDHPVLNRPNKITKEDFEGWVQERGLYFAGEWDERYTPILASNDPGEDPVKGGLIVSKHGDGYFVYTGYSWFRQLPAGVPGAFRLFTNLISLGQNSQQ